MRLLLLALLPLLASAQSSLLPGDPLAVFRYSGSTAAGRAEIVDVEGQDFTRAFRLITLALPVNEWDNRIRVRGSAPVSKGDAIVATFFLRCLEPANGECVIKLNVERADSPYTKSVNLPYLATAAWRPVKLVFRMAEDYNPNAYYIDFWLGSQIQAAEVGGISFDNYGPDLNPADVGIDPLYEGASPDAPWRAAAEERINQIRKADLQVIVQDPDGNPIPEAEVHIAMQRHAFGFGTAVAADQLLGSSEDSDKYRQFILDNFNLVVLENDLKWPGWEQNPTRALRAIQWLRDNGITNIRGHNLVWPNWQYLPADVKTLANDPDALRQRILDHIQDVVSANRGTLMDWDVLNEPYTNKDLQKILGDEEMAAWFNKAREYDPDVKLFINDYSILSANGADLPHRNGYFNIIQYLLDLGAPIDGLGMQGHFGSATPPEVMLRIIDRFAQFNKQIEITEYDFNSKDEQLQATFTRDLLLTAFSHPAMTNFLMWGFWEGRHWIPDGAMVRKDWTTKPMYDAWREMVYQRWWTNETGLTAEDGTLTTRGFLGQYQIEVKSGDKTQTVPATLGSDGATVSVILQ
jgi:GH35 family endo-1,4-beta-xylanase